jgi:cytochrome c biogenesis protein CcmG, thiol:disulfide interchange protein DsbE
MKKQKSSKFRVILMAALGCFVLAALGVGLLWASGRGQGLLKAIRFRMTFRAGVAAPDFTLPTLAGEQLSLSQFRGKPVMLNFGASWCPDCRKELPLLQKLQTQYPDLVIFYVDTEEPVETVRAYVEKFQMTWPVVLDKDGVVGKQYLLSGVPYIFFVDKDGIIQKVFIETLTEQQALESLAAVGIQP